MARPRRCRRVCREPEYGGFSPDGIAGAFEVILSVDEFEVLRLVDLEKKTHSECAAQMEVSRTTITEIYESARYKVADSLVNGKRLVITGGSYRLCNGTSQTCGNHCRKDPASNEIMTPRKEGIEMRIAATYDSQTGDIFQHFGHTEAFKIYDVEDGKIISSQVVGTNGSGHGALAGFLLGGGVNVLICGGIGMGAQNALAQAGIQLFGGVSGSADGAVEALLAGTLLYNPDVQCNHHGHGHEHGHNCGGHGHGHDHGHNCGSHGGSCHN
ncbi:MAG: DUF134 domain-containing protein [Ruminiclostridium sp.]|nr:DUF134 domain-containing protein [Ruminiclostridium sp.]MBQ9933529.1 DUF134 domain-containing protein [Ruminiclostridium sp.]